MEILYLLLPVTFLFVVILVGCVIWATLNDQFENFEDAASRILTRDSDATANAMAASNQESSSSETVKPE